MTAYVPNSCLVCLRVRLLINPSDLVRTFIVRTTRSCRLYVHKFFCGVTFGSDLFPFLKVVIDGVGVQLRCQRVKAGMIFHRVSMSLLKSWSIMRLKYSGLALI